MPITRGDTEAVPYAAEGPPALMKEVLATLERWSSRTGEHVTRLRAAERQLYRGVQVLAQVFQPAAGPELVSVVATIPLAGRNISRSGVCLIAAPSYAPCVNSDRTPVLYSRDLFVPGSQFAMRLPLKQNAGLVVLAEVVRARPVYHGFLEIGARFTKKEDGDSVGWAVHSRLLN